MRQIKKMALARSAVESKLAVCADLLIYRLLTDADLASIKAGQNMR
jgi:hypothetical protein